MDRGKFEAMTDEEQLALIGMTPEEADSRAREFEEGAWDRSEWGEPRRGRPSLSDGPVRVYSMRFPVELMAYVDDQADEHGRSRSEELRAIVAESRARNAAVA